MSQRDRFKLLPRLGDSPAEHLALLAKKGDRVAFADLVKRFEPRLHSFLVERVRCHSEAADLSQAAFLKAWLHIADYSPKWKFSTWLFVIAHRLAISHLRTHKRPTDPAELAGIAAQHAHKPNSSAAVDVWSIARDVLPDDVYVVLQLRYVEDLSINEIAQVVDRSEVAVRVSLFRARKKLAELIPAPTDSATIPTELKQGVSC